jgi:hypothetical protein
LIDFFKVADYFCNDKQEIIRKAVQSYILSRRKITAKIIVIIIANKYFASLVLGFLFLTVQKAEQEKLRRTGGKNNQYHNNVDFINQRKRCRNAYNTYAKLIARIEKIRRTRIIAAVKLHCSLILFSAARAFDICIIGVQILIESKHRIAHTNNARAAV